MAVTASGIKNSEEKKVFTFRMRNSTKKYFNDVFRIYRQKINVDAEQEEFLKKALENFEGKLTTNDGKR